MLCKVGHPGDSALDAACEQLVQNNADNLTMTTNNLVNRAYSSHVANTRHKTRCGWMEK